ncbi:MAG: hypothetical protein U0822_27610 [Anaerolineae bacterium]
MRVESQAWESPGDPAVNAVPIAAVAELLNYSSPTKVTQATAYNLFPEDQGYYWQIGAGDASGLQGGVAVIGIPSLMQRGNAYNMVTDVAVQNLVPKPGFTDFVMYVYDQNGLLDYVCEKLNEKQVEYINLANWNWIQPGFVGSAVISAVYWEHDVLAGIPVFGSQNPQIPILLRNVVGLAAVKVERVVPGGAPVAGDVTAASEGFPIPPGFDFEGYIPQCPGVPTSCAPIGALVITVCAPVYAGAFINITDDTNGQAYFSSQLDENGQAFFTSPPSLPSGHNFHITIGSPDPDHPGQYIWVYTSPATTVWNPGPPLGNGTDPTATYTAKVPGISQVINLPCQSEPGAILNITLTPPVGLVEGYLSSGAPTFASASPSPSPLPLVPQPPAGSPDDGGLWPGAPLNPAAGREVQLWLPPSAANQSGTYLRSATTNTEGYFHFDNVNPCLIYEVKTITSNGTVQVVANVVATVSGQKYMLALNPLPTTGLYITAPGPRPIP